MSHPLTAPIARWLAHVLGYSASQIFEAAPNAPAPDGDYASFNFLGLANDAFSFATREENDEMCDTTRTRGQEFSVSVNIFAADCIGAFADLTEGMHDHAAREILRPSGLVFVRLGQARNLQFINGPNYKPRWQAELIFRRLNSKVDSIELVYEMNITGEMGDYE